MQSWTDRLRCLLIAACLAPLSVAVAASSAVTHAGPALKAGVFDPPRHAPQIELQGSNDRPLNLEQHRGKVVLLGFGFTSCPQVCPTTLATLAQAVRKLGPRAADVQVIFVTVDPERDDAQRMRKYLGGFDPAFLGATGTAAQLAAVRERYGVMAEKQVFGNSYSVGHSTSTYLIDREGRLRALMPYGRSAEDYIHDLTILLGQ